MLFSYGSGRHRIDGNKNAEESLAILIAVAIQWYNVGRIAQWSTSRASHKATGCAPSGNCLHHIAPAAATFS